MSDLNQMLDTMRAQMDNRSGTDPAPHTTEALEEPAPPEPIEIDFPEAAPEEASPYDPA
ncbi:hypothetical protein BOO71_0002314 [Deinococcus marmoris]|uniref:Uncharacterized protein n=1 Tax=Deinococcus marmoris TaxID=249408 RepID=A0A1U7P2W9_9DEIO|nr:hypothetical protein BOO71_0002314 [Deinococcus marmoris]